MLIEIVLPLILIVIMFSLGLELGPRDFAEVALRPKAFALGAFNQMLVVPLAAFVLAMLFSLPPELAVGLMILAASPGGVLSNSATRLAGGNVALSISLTAVISLAATLTLPLVVAFAVGYFRGAEAPALDVTGLGLTVFVLTAAPVGLGVLVRRYFPRFVAKSSAAIARFSMWLFLVTIVAAVIANWQAFADNIGSLWPVLIALNATLLAVGCLTASLARLPARDMTAIAIETGTQNGALGIAVGLAVAATSTGLPDTTLPSVIYSITAWILTMPFVLWRRSRSSSLPATAPDGVA
ncbi:bile acid:sodium symporter family protein [Ciceribacter sp. L1K23]|uniref:bile acid:sodium symporter family protein n=1 Tax=Ciceribacter sp. L1K23 TaxID=2820276 RepID=UPI001B84351C|nr:bile acid:sodium symporter family protein [Ciceribacter sp. L1K23]MBR0556584.1 bile acid:sodium symporter family protein [Ciceribacter sp. L1K23]